MTLLEAMEFGRSISEDFWLDRRTGKPLIKRADWEQLPRWRRIRDVLLGCQPLKRDPKDFPPVRSYWPSDD